MIEAHLTEMEVQLYVAEPQSLSIERSMHVEGCALCKSKAANYALVFKSLQDFPKPAFDFDLSALVMEKLPAPKRAFPWAGILISVLSFAVIAVAAVLFGPILITIIAKMQGVLLTIALAVAVLIIIFQMMEILRDHQKRMHVLLS